MQSFHDYLKLQSPEFASELDDTFDAEGLKVFNSLAEAWASEQYHKKDPAQTDIFPVTPYDGMR
ncbi:MAG TPA: hypothetical protein VN038_01420 [Dyadobacter sp.]|nr:hypothetical protein [Dyadobacter sp.]